MAACKLHYFIISSLHDTSDSQLDIAEDSIEKGSSILCIQDYLQWGRPYNVLETGSENISLFETNLRSAIDTRVIDT